MARPPSTLATARMNAPVLPSSSQSQLNNPMGAGLLMTTQTTSLATVSTATSTLPAGNDAGVMRPPMIPGLGQPQFMPPNMAATTTSIATATSLATSKNTSTPSTRLTVSGTNVVSSTNSVLRSNNAQGAPNMVVQRDAPAAPILVQGPQGPRLITPLGGANQLNLSTAVTSQTDAGVKTTGAVTMAAVTVGDTSKTATTSSGTMPTIKVTVPGTIPKTVVSMATAVMSADGTIVVTLPPGADPKNFVVNQGTLPKPATSSGGYI